MEAYNFRDVKCLFRADIFWRWRLSTSAGTLRRGLGFPKVLASSLRGGSPEICGRYGRGAEVRGLYGL